MSKQLFTPVTKVFCFRSILFFCAFAFSASVHTQSQDKVFQIGKVTSNPSKQYGNIWPMAGYLSNELGYARGKTVFARNIDEMLDLFRQSKVDFFTGSAWEAATIIEAGLGEAIAVKHKEGRAGYQSLIVVRADSNINSLSDLASKTIAFEDASSTSGYRVPAKAIEEAGISMVRSREMPSGEELNYRFTGSEQNSSALLYRGRVDAIALSNLDWEKADNVPEFQKEQFRIIYQSATLPRAIEVVRKDLSEETKIKLKTLLLSEDIYSQAGGVLYNYHETSGFSDIESEILEEFIAMVRFFKN